MMIAMKGNPKETYPLLEHYDDLILRIIRGKTEVHKLAGRFEKGIIDLKRILNVFRNRKPKNVILEAETLMHISYLSYDGLNDCDKAEQAVNEALRMIPPAARSRNCTLVLSLHRERLHGIEETTGEH